MEALRGLRLIEGLESRLERMYKVLSKRHKNDQGASDFFAGLAKDEHTHLEMARMETRMVRSAGHPVGQALVDEAEIQRVVGLADRLTKEEMPLHDALEIVLEIESSAAEFYVQTALSEADPAISKLLSTMGETFRAHLETVRDFLEAHGISAESLALEPKDSPAAHPAAPAADTALLVNSASQGQDALRIYSATLESSGYETIVLPGRTEAEALLKDKRPGLSLIFLDIENEEDENMGLIPLIRGLPGYSEVPVVVFTTNYATEFMRKARGMGASRILYKMSTPPEKLAQMLKPDEG
jgi:rubrerythrin